MTDAEYYQTHKDDEGEWEDVGQPTPDATPKRRLAAMISTRFSPEEAARVRSAAELSGESLSSFVRTAVLQRCSQLTGYSVSLTGGLLKGAAIEPATRTAGGSRMSPVSDTAFVSGEVQLELVD